MILCNKCLIVWPIFDQLTCEQENHFLHPNKMRERLWLCFLVFLPILLECSDPELVCPNSNVTLYYSKAFNRYLEYDNIIESLHYEEGKQVGADPTQIEH